MKRDFGVTRATASGKDLRRRDKTLSRNIAIDYELDQL